MSSFSNKDAGKVVGDLVKIIQENKAYLSEIDGAIGDGDHGINMNKGFTMFQERFNVADLDLSTALKELGTILLTEIGGSMGPIYGTIFRRMAKAIKGKDTVAAADFAAMLQAAVQGVQELGEAKKGDKTLMDTLVPGLEAFDEKLAAGGDFKACLEAMKTAAKAGWESTKDMQARIGRASRLGERSIGVLDAGATSCWLILQTLANGIEPLLK